MSNQPAHNLTERSAQRWHEVADWVSANSLDLALAAGHSEAAKLLQEGITKQFRLKRD